MKSRLVIVGPGRLGRSAAQILRRNGHEFVLVGRGEPIPAAFVTWLTVPDKAVESVAMAVPSGGVVLHASGALDHDVLRPHAPAGSLHPLMSFPGPEIGMPETDIPAAVSGDADAIEAALSLADLLDFSAVRVPGNRALYHAAAVTAGNFATTLMVQAGRMLANTGLTETQARTLLAPLAITSIKNAIEHGPDALTGPVARGDDATIETHRKALSDVSPELSAFYLSLCDATKALKK